MQSTDINFYLLLFNISKVKNAGTLVRSAAAFNCKEVFTVEKKKSVKDRLTFGSQGTEDLMDFRLFDSLTQIKEYCKANQIFICGVEICPKSESVSKFPFKGSTLFVVGNEGTGLNVNQKEICDHFVYIPQYTEKTASLNVAIAGSIVMEHFAVWACFTEKPQKGEKYVTDEEMPKGKIINEGKIEEKSEEGSMNLFGDYDTPVTIAEKPKPVEQQMEGKDNEGCVNLLGDDDVPTIAEKPKPVEPKVESKVKAKVETKDDEEGGFGDLFG